MLKLAGLLLLASTLSYAESVGKSFPPGSGASYRIKMKSSPVPIELSIYVAGSRTDSVQIEYFMQAKSLTTVEMWQQFDIGIRAGQGAEVRKGYVLTKELTAPETMPDAYLKGAAGGVQVNDFVFASKAQLDKNRIGEEMVEIAAGSTKATHYRTVNNGQTVDYWISDEAKPLGLVMLISKSDKNPNQNYGIELLQLVENVKPKILPEQAVPLTEKGRALLAKPESMR